MKKGLLLSIIPLAIVALLFLSELIFSSGPGLGEVATFADTLGWTEPATRTYFLILAFLDLLGGVGAAVCLWVIWSRNNSSISNFSFHGTVVVLVIYALYQGSTAFRLEASLRPLYITIGVVYLILAAVVWFIHQRRPYLESA